MAELFLAREAAPAVVARYEEAARRVGVARIIENLVHLVTGVALVEQIVEPDALVDVQPLGDAVELIDDAGRMHRRACTTAPPDRETEAADRWLAAGRSGVDAPVSRSTPGTSGGLAWRPRRPAGPRRQPNVVARRGNRGGSRRRGAAGSPASMSGLPLPFEAPPLSARPDLVDAFIQVRSTSIAWVVDIEGQGSRWSERLERRLTALWLGLP